MDLTKVMMEFMSVLIELILLLTNVSGNHSRSKKMSMYVHTVGFMLVATVIDLAWNIIRPVFDYKTAIVGKAMVCIEMQFGTLGVCFLGMYLWELINERQHIKRYICRVSTVLTAFTLIYLGYASAVNKLVAYYAGQMVSGPYFSNAMHMIIVIGLLGVLIIIVHTKILGAKDTFITLAYFVLPVVAVVIKLQSPKYDFIYSFSSISLLIVNNLLISREKNMAMANQRIAEESEHNKSRFLANMSHEIRTPINAVLGLNELILREANDPAILGYAHDIKSSGNQLLNIVNDVLDFSKIESGKMELVPVSYESSSLLNDVVNMINIKAEQKGLSFRIEVDSTVPRILYGDEVRIKQIMTNILSNSVKYTKEGWVRLAVGYEKTDDFEIMLRVTVEDTGVGMKEEDISKLFVPFERIDEKNNINIEGTGLGMAITNYYLKLMGSELQVESIYGSGSIFSFAIKQRVENWEPMGDYEEAFKKLRNKNDKYKAKFKAPEAKILVVDDMPMNLTVVQGLLKPTKINIDTATSGEEALELLSYNKYDVIYLDHMMPGLSGIETLEKLKADKASINIKTPVVMLTANAVVGARDTYMDAGFDDYLTKPINPDKLEKSLIKYLPEGLVEYVEASEESESQTSDDPRLGLLKTVPGISVEDGISASADEQTYLIAAEEFTLSIDDIADKIERFYESGDIENYTILVHGLKTAARLIGQKELSELSYELEMAGKGKDIDTIEEKTSKLLQDYRNLKKYLMPIFESRVDEADLKDLDEAGFNDATDTIKSAIEEFDFDTISSVMDQLKEYKIPEEHKDFYEKFKLAVSNVDFDEMARLINAL